MVWKVQGMKVLMRETFLPGNRYALELCKELKKHADLVLLCKRNAGEIENSVNCKKIIYTKSADKIRSIGSYFMSLVQEFKELKKGKYDIYHIQSYKNLYLEVPLFYIAKKYCKAVVTTVHNVLPHEVAKSDRRLHELWYRTSDALIVHNEATRECLIEEFPFTASKVHVIPHGTYSVQKYTGDCSEKNKKTAFLLFGQLRPYKGIDILIQAIACLPSETRSVIQVVIAGNQHPKQDRTDYLDLIHKYHVEDCVDFQKGRVPDEALPEMFGRTDFCLFPYREIYGSGALLMAYSYQKPVIASNVPAFIEETDHGRTGLLFENENSEDLAGKIETAVSLKKEEIDLYKSAISELVTEKYNWNVSARKLFETYRGIINR